VRPTVLAIALLALGCARGCGARQSPPTTVAPAATLDAREIEEATGTASPYVGPSIEREPVRGIDLDARPPVWPREPPPEAAQEVAPPPPLPEEPPPNVFIEEPPDVERDEPADLPEPPPEGEPQEEEGLEDTTSGPFEDRGDALPDPDTHDGEPDGGPPDASIGED
jgi:hypothetical protein